MALVADGVQENDKIILEASLHCEAGRVLYFKNSEVVVTAECEVVLGQSVSS